MKIPFRPYTLIYKPPGCFPSFAAAIDRINTATTAEYHAWLQGKLRAPVVHPALGATK